MLLHEAGNLARQLMKENGLGENWKFSWDRSKRRFGLCSYRGFGGIISLSEHLVILNDIVHVKNVILHEIAHALVGPRHHHDWTWKQKAVSIGCTGDRCYGAEVEKPAGNYVAHCPKCDKKHEKFRATRRRFSCHNCSGGRFDERYLLTFTRK